MKYDKTVPLATQFDALLSYDQLETGVSESKEQSQEQVKNDVDKIEAVIHIDSLVAAIDNQRSIIENSTGSPLEIVIKELK